MVEPGPRNPASLPPPNRGQHPAPSIASMLPLGPRLRHSSLSGKAQLLQNVLSACTVLHPEEQKGAPHTSHDRSKRSQNNPSCVKVAGPQHPAALASPDSGAAVWGLCGCGSRLQSAPWSGTHPISWKASTEVSLKKKKLPQDFSVFCPRVSLCT